MLRAALAGMLLCAVSATPRPVAADTLAEIRARGAVACGRVVNSWERYSATTDSRGDFFLEYCRALAAAVLGDAFAVEPVYLTQRTLFQALRDRTIDVISSNTTWSIGRETTLGIRFPAIVYYDGMGILVRSSLGIEDLAGLDRLRICVSGRTTTEANLVDFVKSSGRSIEIVRVVTTQGSIERFLADDCQAIASDRLTLERLRHAALPRPEIAKLLPETLSREPIGLVVRAGDPVWSAIVRWTVHAMILAEEKGVTSANVEVMRASTDPEVRRLLGMEGDLGPLLGLERDWAAKVIAQVGNYGEVFSLRLGKDSPFKLERGLNDLWTRGGLIYAPPFR